MQLGQRFGPYDIVDVLGQGGMGVVYRARDSRLGRDVAIKTLPAQIAADPVRLQRFEQEAQAASRLNHPNVLSVFDAGEHEGTPYLVTELLEGQTLRERLTEGPLPVRKAIELAVAIAQGLSAVHEKGIVHRDLKPENVFLTIDGRVKILDFGVARMLELATPPVGTLPLTQEGAVMGTAGYMSPEQVRGRPADSRSDLFALGAILYELVTGRLAFDGESAVERGYAILNRDPPPLGVPNPALERVIWRCVEKSPEQRFQNARDLAFALEAITDAGSSSVPVPGPMPAARSRARLPWAIAGATGALALTLLLMSLSKGRHAEPSVGQARPVSAAMAPRFTRVAFRNGWVSSARFTGEKGIVYSGAFEGEQPRVVTGVIGSASSRPVSEPDATLLDVSSSGELAIGQFDHDLKRRWERGSVLSRVALAGGTPRQVMEHVVSADFGPKDTMLVVREEPSRVTVEYPIGHVVLSKPKPCMVTARLSPSGDRIAWVDSPVVHDDRGSVVLMDTQGRELARSPFHWSVQGLAWRPDGQEVWFTAADTGDMRSIRALDTTGHEREVFAAPGSLVLFDIDRAGRVLAAMRIARFRVFGRVGSASTELQPLSYFNGSQVVDLATDGSAMLFVEGQGSEGSEIETYLRRFDGTPPVRLSGGWGRALSPDQKWAVVSLKAPFTTLALVPTGPGLPRELPSGGFAAIHGVRFFSDGKRIAISARGPDGKLHLYTQDVTVSPVSGGLGGLNEAAQPQEGAEPRQLGDEEVFAVAPPSPDGRHLAAWTPKGEPVLVEVESGAMQPLGGLEWGDKPVQWTSDGRALWVARDARAPSMGWELFRLALSTKKLTHVSHVGPADTVGVQMMREGFITPDGNTYVFDLHQTLDELYVIEGLR